MLVSQVYRENQSILRIPVVYAQTKSFSVVSLCQETRGTHTPNKQRRVLANVLKLTTELTSTSLINFLTIYFLRVVSHKPEI